MYNMQDVMLAITVEMQFFGHCVALTVSGLHVTEKQHQAFSGVIIKQSLLKQWRTDKLTDLCNIKRRAGVTW